MISTALTTSVCNTPISPSGTVVKNPPANAGDAGDLGSTPGSRRCPGGGHDSCLGNPVDKRSLADYTSWGRRESDPIELSLTYHVKRVHIYSILSLKKQVSQQYELYNQFTLK